MIEQQFIPSKYLNSSTGGQYSWSSPSNIALVKYWGKKEHQIPENPSISFTLDACKTTTVLSFEPKDEHSNYEFEVFLDGELKKDFKPKIETFFKRIEVYLPFLKEYAFKINTRNTFPHSSGIASSASGMSALSLCLMSIEKQLNPSMSEKEFIQKASFLARLGSGSASRSLEGNLVVWGEHKEILGSSNYYGVKYPFEVHEKFDKYHDTILLVDKSEKRVSSTLGHKLMYNHPFAEQRFEQAHRNLSKLINAFKEGDLCSFVEIVESEALTLHAMMMTSMPYFILMKANTLKIINKIWEFRKATGSDVCFTLDAGANVHVLYPEYEAERVYEFIKNELVAYCENGHYICDRIGFGAKQLPI